MSLGETIRELRTARRLSQSELADALRVSRQSVSKWETDSAAPDLDKLVRMSELFEVTLDALVRGEGGGSRTAPREEAAPPRDARPPHGTAGIIFLCFGGLIALVLLLLGGGLASLLFAAPFLLCGVICLNTKTHTGLWCGWAVFFCADFYLRYATGITWSIIFLTPHFTPEMNYIRLAIGWGQFAYIAALVIAAMRSYRSLCLPWNRRSLVAFAAGWGLFAVETVALRHLHSLPAQVDDALYFWLRACGSALRLPLLAALLTAGAALLRGRRGKGAA